MPLGALGITGLATGGAGLAANVAGAFGVGADEGGPELAFFPSRSVNRFITSLAKSVGKSKELKRLGFDEEDTRGDVLVDTDSEYARKFGLANLGTTESQLFGGDGQGGILDILKRTSQGTQGLIDQDLAQRGDTLAKFREGDPILKALFGQAEEELASGGALDPATRREVQQGARSAQADRGMGFGNSDVYEELMGIGSQAEARRRRQQEFAMNLLQSPADLAQRQAAATPASPLQSALQLFGMGSQLGQQSGPTLMQNPFGPSGVANQPGSNPLSAIGGGLMGTGGQLLGAGLSNQNPPSNTAGLNTFVNPDSGDFWKSAMGPVNG